jgi:alpha-aminoadipate carrier protein LysW
MIHCPLCATEIDVDEEELDEGDSLICEDCGANLNVSGVSPLELTPDADEDVDDDEEDEDGEQDDYDEDDDDDDDEDEEEV